MLYFNNPFAEPVFARVLRNIQVAHERAHRKVYVLYQQLAGDLETDRTRNIARLRRCAFLRERQVRFPSRRAATYWARTSCGCSNPSSSRRRSGRSHTGFLRAPAVAAVNATRTGSHFGDTPRSRTSGRSNSRSTSRASARRRTRSRR